MLYFLSRVFVFLAFFLFAYKIVASPRLTELMAGNESSIADEDGDFSDWIEIHNSETSSVDLSGWHLTDDDDDLASTFETLSLKKHMRC